MPVSSNEWVQKAIDAANNAGIPSNATAGFLGIIQQESGFNPYAPNNQNANGTYDTGIAQLNSQYYPGADSWTPEQQLAAAANTYMQNWNSTGGDLAKTIQMYNPKAPPSYLSNILDFANQFAMQLGNIDAGLGGNATGIPGVPSQVPGSSAVVTGVQPVKPSPTGSKVMDWITEHATMVGIVAIGSLIVMFSLYEGTIGGSKNA
jgi:Transglycosylase SLT domain